MKDILSAVLIVAMMSSFTAHSSVNRLGNVSVNGAKEIISGWPVKTKEVATTNMVKYGAPTEMTGTMQVWHNNRP